MEQAFWMVWCESTCHTRVRHASPEEARREAERLAQAIPGQRFFVLQATGIAQTVKPVTWTDLESELPF